MTLKEFYDAVGGDYSNVMQRLCDEEFALEFLFRFADESLPERLKHAIDTKNREEAFTISHTLKGTCVNLGLSDLYASASKLTDALRTTFSPEVPALFDAFLQDYQRAIQGIRTLQG